ncbi:MAG: hypothetical protein M1156_00505, partial [Candidatus Marsarchaeota archaeon]|nr:hypothetical protein [Candidatus Marsarchaeota archaeon]
AVAFRFNLVMYVAVNIKIKTLWQLFYMQELFVERQKFVMLKIDVSGQDPSKAEEEINSRIKSTISSNGSAKPVIRIELKGRMKEGFKASDLNISKMPASYPEAIVEIARTNVDDASSAREIADLRQGLLENVPIKDYGMALFLDRLKASNYSMKISPSKLFEILSSDSKKDTAISKAVEELFS